MKIAQSGWTTLLAILGMACGGGDSSEGKQPNDTPNDSKSANAGSGQASTDSPNGDFPTNDAGSASPSCTSSVKDYIYVTATGDGKPKLFRFQPSDLSMDLIGTIDCDWRGQLAIDRSGTAWAIGGDGVVNIDIQTGGCTIVNKAPPLQAINTFAFAANEDGTESLFAQLLTLPPSQGNKFPFHFARVKDPISMDTELLGSSYAQGVEAFSATGTGKLVALTYTTRSGRSAQDIAEVNLQTGETTSIIELDNTNRDTPFASGFAFWGGSYWIFGALGPSNDKGILAKRGVARVDPTTKKAVTVLHDVDYTGTGDNSNIFSKAAVSTCVPPTAPN